MRSSLRSGSWLLSLMSFLAACGGAAPPAAAPPAANIEACSLEAELEAARAKARILVERACGCATSACLVGVGAELDALVMTGGEAVGVRAEVLACHKRVEHRAAAAALDELELLRRDACACADAACADGIQERFEAFMQQHKDTKGSEEQATEAGQVAEQMQVCMTSARGPAPAAD